MPSQYDVQSKGLSNLQLITGIGFLTAVALLIALIVLSYKYRMEADHHERWVAHTYDVRRTLDRIVADLVDIENRTRGFLITGNPGFLASSPRVAADFRHQVPILAGLVSDDPGQLRRVRRIDSLAQKHLRNADAVIGFRKSGRLRDAIDSVYAGKDLLDSIRSVVTGAQAYEQALLEERTAAEKSSTSRYTRFSIAATVLGLIVIAITFLLLSSELKRRRLVEQKLLEYQRGLSDTVNERTTALRKSERLLREIIDDNPFLVTIKNREGTFILVNKALQKVTGKHFDQLVGRNDFDIYAPEVAATHRQYDNRVLESGEGFQFEEVISAGDEQRVFLVNKFPLRDDEGRFYGIAAFSQDITYLKQLESDLRFKTANLERANEELEAFVYSVTHDLRNPLTVIKGFGDTVMKMYGRELDDQGREFLLRITDSARKMDAIIEDLLKLFRVSRAEMVRKKTDLGALAASIVEDLRHAEPQRGVEFVVGSGLEANADPNLMKVALSNLIGNAWKFTRNRSDARIEFADCSEPDERIFCLKDNGAGFDMAKAGRLFKPFQRLHSEKEFPGTGIGLAIVNRVIRLHGGRIWAQSEPGKGAAFYFNLGNER